MATVKEKIERELLRRLATISGVYSVSGAVASVTDADTFVLGEATGLDVDHRRRQLRFTSGVLAGQVREIVGYDPSTRQVDVLPAFSQPPSAGDTCAVMGVQRWDPRMNFPLELDDGEMVMMAGGDTATQGPPGSGGGGVDKTLEIEIGWHVILAEADLTTGSAKHNELLGLMEAAIVADDQLEEGGPGSGGELLAVSVDVTATDESSMDTGDGEMVSVLTVEVEYRHTRGDPSDNFNG